MDNSRKKAWLTAAASLAVMVASSLLMAQRVTRFHEQHPRDVYAFQPLDMRSFKFAGRPVTITDDKSDKDDPKLIVTYGQDTVALPVTMPLKYDLPDLKSHEDWLRVVRFAPRSNVSDEKFAENLGQGEDRLAIVTKTPVKGVDPETWGRVWKTNWVFDFYELRREGGFAHEQLGYPTTHDIAKPIEGQLKENTWEFQAALLLMPMGGGIGPTHNFYGDALTAASWTLPLAAFSGLVAAISIAFGFAPIRAAAQRNPRP